MGRSVIPSTNDKLRLV